MELLIFFFGALYLFGFVIAGTILAVGCAAIVALALIMLAIRFWYLVAIAMFIMVFPVLYLEGWLVWILVPIIVFAVAMWFIPVPDEQKADYEKAKAEFKASRNSLISKS
ncbi:hypothetical protein [Avibacterium paragallinarum]|uniref:Uncharacterized protein n=4 Tax=Avibacterium paragallinarum TaxID=728 RepID=A0AAE5TJG1_AVIPA|nr:hypothetical protein [Avibacterium paragallinarum]PXZ40753.1 hypothetical protein DM482_01040 [Avibacterium paragallinarum]QZP16800.1 hypothetical protein K5O18_05775 [Avibacterium paragallinarum]WAL56857.1 hypothetical protein OY678_00315 [Avibacterium paragallinarum]